MKSPVNRTQIGLALGMLALSANVAVAAVDSYTATFPLAGGTSTLPFPNGTSIVLPLFNPSLGTLVSIKLTLDGTLIATQKAENLDSQPATLQVTTDATLRLKRPSLSDLVVTVPEVNNSANLLAYDGVTDSAGTSGVTFSPTTSTASNNNTFTSGGDLALFTGAGTISLPLTATGISFGQGPSNLQVSATAVAGASVLLEYTYTPFVSEVPEASTYGSIGAVALVGFLGYRRSRKASDKVA